MRTMEVMKAQVGQGAAGLRWVACNHWGGVLLLYVIYGRTGGNCIWQLSFEFGNKV